MFELSHFLDVVAHPRLHHVIGETDLGDPVEWGQRGRSGPDVHHADVMHTVGTGRPGVLELKYLGAGNALDEANAGFVKFFDPLDHVDPVLGAPTELFDDVEPGAFAGAGAPARAARANSHRMWSSGCQARYRSVTTPP